MSEYHAPRFAARIVDFPISQIPGKTPAEQQAGHLRKNHSVVEILAMANFFGDSHAIPNEEFWEEAANRKSRGWGLAAALIEVRIGTDRAFGLAVRGRWDAGWDDTSTQCYFDPSTMFDFQRTANFLRANANGDFAYGLGAVNRRLETDGRNWKSLEDFELALAAE